MTMNGNLIATGGNGLVNRVISNYGDKLKEVWEFAIENFGDIKLNREDYARAIGADPEDVTTAELIDDILRHFDTNEIARNNPEVASTTWKTASLIAGMSSPYAIIPAALVNALPEKYAAKVVEFSGILTPSHLIRKGLKSRIRKENGAGRINICPQIEDDFICAEAV